MLKHVTITLDPDYDTPFVMSQAAQEFAAHAPRWRFASGKPRDIRALMAAFGVIARKGEDGVPDVHSVGIYLLDDQGRLARSTLLSTDAAEQLDGDLTSFRRAAPRAGGRGHALVRSDRWEAGR